MTDYHCKEALFSKMNQSRILFHQPQQNINVKKNYKAGIRDCPQVVILVAY